MTGLVIICFFMGSVMSVMHYKEFDGWVTGILLAIPELVHL